MPTLSGVVTGANGGPARRTVRVYLRSTGALVSEVASDAATGAWSATVSNTAEHFAVFHDGTAGDPSWTSVIALLHMNGANNATTFTDEKGHAFTAVGNAKVSTAQSKFGGSSLLLDGAGDYLSSPSHADWALGSGNFTIEAFVRLAGYATNNGGQYKSAIVAKDVNANRSFGFFVTGTSSSFTSLDFVGFSDNSTGYTAVSGSYTFNLNTWYHVAAVRSGNLVYLFVDGVLLNAGGTAFSRTIQTTTNALLVGASEFDATYKYYLNGNIDELRITKGVARYTANFTPPAEEYPAALTGGALNAIVFDRLVPA